MRKPPVHRDPMNIIMTEIKYVTQHGRSLRAIAKGSGVPYSTLYNLIAVRFNPSLSTLTKLARYFDLRIVMEIIE